MSKLKSDKINFGDDDFIIEGVGGFYSEIKKNSKNKTSNAKFSDEELKLQLELAQAKKDLENAKHEAQMILQNAKAQADEILSKMDFEAQEQKAKIIEEAQKEAQEILNQANVDSQKEANDLLENSKQEIEQAKIQATNEGYNDGYKDAQEKIQEELEEKIENLSKFCLNQLEIKEKIIKSASKDILDLIINISKKVLLKEVDAQTIDKIIKGAIVLLEKKENINIIVSEKYAKLLFELQKKSLSDDIELNFEEFSQYGGFDIVYNPKFDDDTIIVENLKERLDASISTQLDALIRNIYENSQNGQIEIEEYIEKNEAE